MTVELLTGTRVFNNCQNNDCRITANVNITTKICIYILFYKFHIFGVVREKYKICDKPKQTYFLVKYQICNIVCLKVFLQSLNLHGLSYNM